jgi:hypothetical protein
VRIIPPTVFFVSLLTLWGCASEGTEPAVAHVASPSPTSTAEARPSPTPDTPIRRIDFSNFTYPSEPIYSRSEKPFTLKDGEYEGRLRDGTAEPYGVSLVDSVYGDVTGDGTEEAMLVLFENVRGSAIPYYVYVYAIERDKPKFLWSFETGDRAQGAFRSAGA